MAILLTGGAGYIGSHTCVELQKAGYEVVIADNLFNSSKKVINRIEKITNRPITFYQGDILDKGFLKEIFSREKIEAVIHFAGLKAVGESTQFPLLYYINNVEGTLNLVSVMNEHNCNNIIFSSSATVYGEPTEMPITEKCPKGICTNPYGWTKSMIEQILMDIQTSCSKWNIVLLRYFNPIGAHESGLIGEAPNGIPNNLMPHILRVASGKDKQIYIFGDDYSTPDGTGVRDYIHVMDLARGHVKALEKIEKNPGMEIYNLGTGKGHSVLELIKSFEKTTGVRIPYSVKPRRKGDIAICYCNPLKAWKELGWKAERDIFEMCRDAWRWEKENPRGYL